MASAYLSEELTCSICLNLYHDPVTLKCGHNFCQVCITDVLNARGTSGVCSCPQCRTELRERPALTKNTTLCNIVESYLTANPEEEVAGILCSNCIDVRRPAVKTCLLCEASLCSNHVKVHSKAPDHVLIEPTKSLKSRKCSFHNEVLKYYCSVESVFVCASCSVVGPHKGHRLDPLEEVSNEKKENVRHVLGKLTTRRKETEMKIQSLQNQRTLEQHNSSMEMERVNALIKNVQERLDALKSQALNEVCRQNVKTSAKISCQIQELEHEKKGLSSRICNLEELCSLSDPLSFLQRLESNRDDVRDDTNRNVCDPIGKVRNWENVQISEMIIKCFDDIMAEAKRQLYLPETSNILLDVNTAGNNVALSPNMKTAYSTKKDQSRPETPERFYYCQVLSINTFKSGYQFWDVDTNESEFWRIGVAYPSMDRKGDKSYIGYNKKSWCLRRWGKEYSAIHAGNITLIPHVASVGIFRVCLDYKDGVLSFYELCSPIKHVHTCNAAFTEPLHAAFFILEGKLKILS